jgi:hypothetical protein
MIEVVQGVSIILGNVEDLLAKSFQILQHGIMAVRGKELKRFECFMIILKNIFSSINFKILLEN